MEPTQDFKSLQDGVQKSLVSTVRVVNRIAAEDLGFQRTANPDVAELLDETSARFLGLSTRLLKSAAKACGVKAPTLEDADDVDMNWRGVVDVVDSVLEKADTALDEYTGLVKRKEPPTSESTPTAKRPKSTAKVIRNANITKPQAHFELQPDNFPTTPWKPILSQKPHATVSLKKSLVTFTNTNGSLQYKHPYETEITNLKYPARVYQTAEPIMYQPVDTTEATWVDTYDGVLEMLEELKMAKEIAVDLEHHDFRTYTGLVSLMQISTREKDWIVDTLQPWRHKLQVLNEAFADPSIIKVFHGAYMDMIWLQRDLGLYVNGLFDTFFACQLLYSGKSLAFLLSKFVDFDADKQYQLADWRMRPIPEEMLYYARSDTHYLLYIYDRVRNDLVAASDRSNPDKDFIARALHSSQELSLSRHEHADFNEETGEGTRGWYGYVLKHSHLSYSSDQFSVFKALWKWRDDTARKEDESPNFVLGTHNLADVARANPPDAKALHSLLPMTAPMARSRVNQIWGQVQAEKAKGGPSLLHFFTSLAPEALGRNGAARLVKATAQLPELEGGVSVGRLPRSQLFGNMPISSRWEDSSEQKNGQDGEIPFPWQRFVEHTATEEEFDLENGASETVLTVQDTPKAEAPAQPMEEADEEFTLRRGKKRKSAAVEEESSSSEEASEPESDQEMAEDADADASGIISMDEDAPKQSVLSKKQRKAQEKQAEAERQKQAKADRKAKKKESKEKQSKEKQRQGGDKDKMYDAVPFDYSKASSVIRPVREPTQGQGRKNRIFDPYSKTGDEPLKGARKAPPVRGERSATFKK